MGHRARDIFSFGLGLQVGANLVGLLSFVASVATLGLSEHADRLAAWAILGVMALMLGREFGVLHFRLPQNARLVPETVFRFGPGLGSFQFGIEMGTGMRTYVTSSLPYAILAISLLSQNQGVSLVLAIGFGAGRAIMTALSVYSADPGRWDTQFWSDRTARNLGAAVMGSLVVIYAVGLI